VDSLTEGGKDREIGDEDRGLSRGENGLCNAIIRGGVRNLWTNLILESMQE